MLAFGVLFGLGHYVQGWSVVIITALLGMLWSVVYLLRRSVVAPMVSHASFNLIEVIGFGLADMRRQLAVLAAAFVITLPLITPRIYASDEVQYFAYLRSLWFDHDVSFENEYQHFWDAGIARSQGFHETYLERQTETGRRISFATIGTAILWSPFYAVADALVGLGLAGGGIRDGYGPPYVRAVAFGSAVYGWLAIVLGWAMAHRLGLGRGALAAALATWFGTPLIFYMYVAPPMAHACQAFAVAAFLFVWLLVRERWTIGGGVALGAAAALMVMVREQDLLIIVAPALDWALAWWRAPEDTLGPPRRRLAGHAMAGRRGLRDRLRAAAPGLPGVERLSVSLAPGRAQVELARAARGRRGRVARARARVLDAAGAARDHRARSRHGRLARLGGATDADPPPRERLDGVARPVPPARRRVAGLRRRQRRVVDGRRRLRATPLRRPVRGLPRRPGGAVADRGLPRRPARNPGPRASGWRWSRCSSWGPGGTSA